jgi:acetyl esterase/lipase
MIRAAGAAFLAILSACSPVGVLNALAPAEGVTVATDIAYLPGERHGLDVYAPAGRSPVVVFIYGGGWKDGEKALYRFVGATLAERGIVTVIPNYRVFPVVRFPGFIEDAAAAVAWTKVNIARYGGEPRRSSHRRHAHFRSALPHRRRPKPRS